MKPTILAIASSVIALTAPLAQEKAPHGATEFDVQQEMLERLGTSAPGEVPNGVDPKFWRVFAPATATERQTALGERLYFDPRLSKDDTVACATCHDVDGAFTDLRPVPEGAGGQLGRRDAPTTMNAILIEPLF